MNLGGSRLRRCIPVATSSALAYSPGRVTRTGSLGSITRACETEISQSSLTLAGLRSTQILTFNCPLRQNDNPQECRLTKTGLRAQISTEIDRKSTRLNSSH